LNAVAAPILTGPAADRLIVRRLDALAAVFDRQSGMTHILASPMPEILAAMTDWTGTADALAARLASEFDLETGDEALADQLAARIDELAALGLIARRA
jgi:PqqD family protein of HPr-rel-A system